MEIHCNKTRGSKEGYCRKIVNMKKRATDIQFTLKKPNCKDYQYCYRLSKSNMQSYVQRHWGKWNPQQFRKDWHAPSTKILIYKGKRIGFYTLRMKKNCAHIENIQISRRYRNKGIGTSILAIIKRQALNAKRKSIGLNTFKDNPAVKLYKREGYKIKIDKGKYAFMEKRL